jgi:arsenate reductase (thioredoxin)
VRSRETGAPLVLFVCRHGAAKSVLAAAELARLASAAGVAIDVRAAGIEPDATVAPAVLAALPLEARTNLRPPRRVTTDDVACAARTVTFDLDPSELPGQPEACERWDGLPSASADAQGFIAALAPRAEALVRKIAPP